jgi:hypothetical protein
MRLLECHNDGEFSLVEHFGDAKPPYAILSHTWGAEEVTFKDIIEGTGKSKVGYEKILFCGECARNDSLQYFLGRHVLYRESKQYRAPRGYQFYV